MRIDLSDARVGQAFSTLKAKHNEYDAVKFAKIFEDVYHCKIVADPNDPWCTTGWIEIPEEKYYTWFAIQFGN